MILLTPDTDIANWSWHLSSREPIDTALESLWTPSPRKPTSTHWSKLAHVVTFIYCPWPRPGDWWSVTRGPNMAGHLFWEIKFYWNTAVFIHFRIVCSCFHATRAELNSYDRDPIAFKCLKVFTLWPFAKKLCRPLAQISIGFLCVGFPCFAETEHVGKLSQGNRVGGWEGRRGGWSRRRSYSSAKLRELIF